MRDSRFHIARVLGFDIFVDVSWLPIGALVAWTLGVHTFPARHPTLPDAAVFAMGIAGTLLLFTSVVAHELGHSVVARRYGVGIRGITLFLFGGVAEMTGEPKRPRDEFFIALAGPATSLAIAVFGVGSAVGLRFVLDDRALPAAEAAWGVLAYVGYLNGALAVFNLVPAFPLDGGRVARAALWALKKDLAWATRVMADVGAAFGLVLLVWGGVQILGGALVSGLWLVLIGLFVRHAARESYRSMLVERALSRVHVRDLMTTDVVTLPHAMLIEEAAFDVVHRTHHRLYPLVDESGTVRGAVTTGALSAVPRDAWAHTRVEEVALPIDDVSVGPDVAAVAALRFMREREQSRLLVMEDGVLVGILSVKDLMFFLSMENPALGANGEDAGQPTPRA